MRRVLALPLALLGSLSAALAQERPTSARAEAVLTVRGTGAFEASPDLASFEAVVVTRAGRLDEAASAHQERATRALSLIREMEAQGAKLEKSSFTLSQQRPVPVLASADRTRAPAAKPPDPPFVAQTTFSLKAAPASAVNAVVTRLAASGLFEVRSVTSSRSGRR